MAPKQTESDGSPEIENRRFERAVRVGGIDAPDRVDAEFEWP